MSVDLRGKRNGFFDKCIMYAPSSVDNFVLKPDASPYGLFYSKDLEVFTSTRMLVGNTVNTNIRGSVITQDDVGDLDVNWFVSKGGKLFKVTAIARDDLNKTKQFSKTPRNTYTINLIGV